MLRRAAALIAILLSSCTIQRWQPAKSGPVDDHMSQMRAADLRTTDGDRSGTTRLGQGTPGLPASASTSVARLAASPRHAEWVKIAWQPGSKDSLMAWIVYPASHGRSPVVVVVHEIFGLSTWVRAVADQLAAEGFIAIAPDLVSRVRGGPSTVELSGDSARKLISGVDYTERNQGVIAAAQYAMTLPSAVQRYAIVGFCWGGTTSFSHAVAGGKGLAAAVAYYGLPYMNGAVPITDSIARIVVPVLLLNGAMDSRIGAAIPAVDSTMKALHKDFAWKNYQGAIHGFLRAQDDPTNPPGAPSAEANLVASKDAWLRTIGFLKQHLHVR